MYELPCVRRCLPGEEYAGHTRFVYKDENSELGLRQPRGRNIYSGHRSRDAHGSLAKRNDAGRIFKAVSLDRYALIPA